ncbi:muscle M-line assembly protein unc-89 isoform X3 [Sardina pilchardus]|uniref:muscle M-line assembly protein unc-89 isoform X3 n=1 Tax=Sardina pilchardus TaxID=27697 RepID=UPI002E1006F9
MESKTSHLVKGRKKLRYFTNDERSLPRIQDVFSVGDIDVFLDYSSKTKLDSGFLTSLLPKGTPEAETKEKEAPEEEGVALPTEEKNIVDGLTDKESPFKDSAPLKTSSPIIVAADIHVDEGEAKLLASPVLFPYDNEDPIEGNMDKPLSILTESIAKEASLHETLILTPPKRFTLAVETKSPTLTPVKNRVNREEKNLSGVLENHTLTEVKMNEEPGSSVSPVVSTQTAVIKEPESTQKAPSVADDGSFQKKLREFLMPRNMESSARMPTPARAPSPQELDEDEDFFILEDDAPLLFSLKPKAPTSRSARQPSKKAEAQAQTGSDAGDGTPAGTENEPGARVKAAGAAPTPAPPAKASAVPKKRGKQSKQTALRAAPEEGGPSEEPCEVGGRSAKGVPAEASSKAPAAQRKTGKQRGRKGAAASATAAEPHTAADADPDADAGVDMASTRPERRPATPISEACSPTAAEDDQGDYGCSPSPSPSVEVPQQTGGSVKKSASKKAKGKPFLSKKKKKKQLSRTSEMFAVSCSPGLKSDTKTSKAASSTTRPETTAKSPAAPAAVSSKKSQKAPSKKEKKAKESKVTRKQKRPAPVPSEEEEGHRDQSRGEEAEATDYSEAGRQDPSQDLSGHSATGRRKRNRPGNWWSINPEREDEDDFSPPKRRKDGKREDGKKPKKTGRPQKEATASLTQDSTDAVEKGTKSPAKSPRQQTGGKATLKSRQRKVKGDGQAGQKRPQTGKGRRKRPQEEAMSAPSNQLEEEEAESDQAGPELQVNMSSDAPAEPEQRLHASRGDSGADAPQPQGRTKGRARGKPPGNWWESQPQPQPEPESEEDIVPSPSQSPPRPAPVPRARVPTPGMPTAELRLRRQGGAKLGSGSRKARAQLAKKPLAQHAGTPKTLKGSLAAFGAIYSVGTSHGRNAVVQKVRKNLLNSLEDSSNRSNDHTSMDGSSQERLNCDGGHQEVCGRVSNCVGLESVMRVKNGDVFPASDWPPHNLGVPGLKSGPSSMIQLQSYEEEEEEEEEERNLSRTLLVPMALSEGDICGPQLRPLTLMPDDWKNLTYWLREVWRTNVKSNGQLVTADHFHWYTHEGRALGHKFDLVCNSYANGKILLGSYMHKPAQVDQHTTTVFNVYTSSVRVQIKDLKSEYIPGQAFVVPRGQSYSIHNLTPVPAILWYHRMFANIMEDS